MLQLHKISDFPEIIPNPNCELKLWITQTSTRLRMLESALSECMDKGRVATLMRIYDEELEMAVTYLTKERYERLPHTLTHGDIHANNLLYNNTGITMILDYDTIDYRPRVYDLAVATYLLTRVKRGTFQLDMRRSLTFVNAYSTESYLNEDERKAIAPLLQLHYIPTAHYLQLMKKESPHLLSWYLDWSLVQHQSLNCG